jgi:hypothetical protein
LASPFFFEATTYWSQGDEAAHFEWLAKIPSIRDVRGAGTCVFLDVDVDGVTANDLRELQAVYRRYGGDLGQLQLLEGRLG